MDARGGVLPRCPGTCHDVCNEPSSSPQPVPRTPATGLGVGLGSLIRVRTSKKVAVAGLAACCSPACSLGSPPPSGPQWGPAPRPLPAPMAWAMGGAAFAGCAGPWCPETRAGAGGCGGAAGTEPPGKSVTLQLRWAGMHPSAKSTSDGPCAGTPLASPAPALCVGAQLQPGSVGPAAGASWWADPNPCPVPTEHVPGGRRACARRSSAALRRTAPSGPPQLGARGFVPAGSPPVSAASICCSSRCAWSAAGPFGGEPSAQSPEPSRDDARARSRQAPVPAAAATTLARLQGLCVGLLKPCEHAGARCTGVLRTPAFGDPAGQLGYGMQPGLGAGFGRPRAPAAAAQPRPSANPPSPCAAACVA